MMSAIKKILVPVDGSVGGCKAVDEALFIAEKCDAELDFVYVATVSGKGSRTSARHASTSKADTSRRAFLRLRTSRAAI